MVGKSRIDQNQEALELIVQLMKKLNCKTDKELAEKLSEHFRPDEKTLDQTQFPKWRKNGLPKNIKALIQQIVHN